MNKKSIIAITTMFAIIFGLSISVAMYSLKIKSENKNMLQDQLAKAAVSSEQASESSSSSSLVYDIQAIKPDKAQNSSSSQAVEKIVTNDGDKTNTTYVDPSYTKPNPTPPPPPKVDETQKNDPNSKPEYKPEDTVKPPPASSTPKTGDKNDKGEVYVSGFGWVMPSKGETVVTENAGKGEVIGH